MDTLNEARRYLDDRYFLKETLIGFAKINV